MSKRSNRVLAIGQSGGPTPVINASLAGALSEYRRQDAFTRIFGLVHGIEGAIRENFLDLSRESPATIERLRYTPASILGSCRYKLEATDYERILAVFRAHEIHDFIYIGGNDSMDTCHRIADLARLSGYELRVVGVPKTIDNDLVSTDHTPGFGSAARFVALATRDAGRDLESMATFDDVIIMETMGRNAGWLTAASVLGKSCNEEAPHLVFVPEKTFDENCFLENVLRVHAELGRVFVVVCEGVRDSEGHPVGHSIMDTNRQDAFGHRLVALSGGVASYLSALVVKELGLQSRFLRPGLIGRVFSACASDTDRQEAYLAGEAAVGRLLRDEADCMICLVRPEGEAYRCEIGSVPLLEVANREKLLPLEYINEKGNMILDGYKDYAQPLIGGALPILARLSAKGVGQRLG